MKAEKNILIAFFLNLLFGIFELVGGAVTGSVAIISDAIHDIGDAAGIGVAWFLEHKSKHRPDATHTYGYGRYSVLGSVFVTLILLLGSGAVIYNAVVRIFHPVQINYNGMILFAIVGVIVNFGAAWFTREGDSLNQKAVNLHMLEDVLGWAVVLVGAIIMRFTDIPVLDPLMSIGVAVFILIHAIKNLNAALDVFLERTPRDICVEEIRQHLLEVPGVMDVHHIHLWTMDGQSHYATLHVVYSGDARQIKEDLREELKEHGIVHATLELETEGEHCHEKTCCPVHTHAHHHHHHHH